VAVIGVLQVVLGPFLLFASLNVALTQLSQRAFGVCMPATMAGSILALYVSQMLFSSFAPAIIALFVCALWGVASALRSGLRHATLLRGITSFAVVYLLFVFVDRGRRFWDFDEFWHWGMMVKETLRLEHFYCVADSHLIIHKDYPPFPALFEAFWCWLCGGFTEGRATTALHVLEFSAVVLPTVDFSLRPSCDDARDDTSTPSPLRDLVARASLTLVLTLALLLVCALFDHAQTIGTILADVPTALFFAYCLLLVVTGESSESAFGFVELLAGATMLLMTKQVGIAMFGVVVLLWLLISLGKRHLPSDAKHGDEPTKTTTTRGFALPVRGEWLRALCLAIAPMLVRMSWSWYVRLQNVSDIRSVAGGNGQFDLGKIDLAQYVAAARGQAADPLLNDTFSHLSHALVFDDVANVGRFPLSFLAITIIMCAAIMAIALLFPKGFSRADARRTAISLFVGSVGFAFMLSVLFLFCFTPDEMQELRGYARYVDSYVIGEVVFAIVFVVMLLARGEERISHLRATLGVLVVLGLSLLLNPSTSAVLSPVRTPVAPVAAVEPVAALLEEVPENASVGVVYDSAESYGAPWFFRTLLQYVANDVAILEPFDLSGRDASSPDTAESLQDYASSCDYLCVLSHPEVVSQSVSLGDTELVGELY
jgi:hypothetical protein